MDYRDVQSNNSNRLSRRHGAESVSIMIFKKLELPLAVFTEASTFIVVGQEPQKKYENNIPTDEIEAIRLTVYDDTKKDRIEVKIPYKTLPFKEEDIEAQTIQVSLLNPVMSVYIDKNGKYPKLAGSVKAEGFKELTKK